MKLLALLPLSILAACGSSGSGSSGATENVVNTDTNIQASGIDPASISFYIMSKKDMPECNKTVTNQLAYIKETEEFYTCLTTGWQTVNIQGKKGDTGADGKDGITQYIPKVYNQAGYEIGKLGSINIAASEYWIYRDDGTRLQVDKTAGTIAYISVYYSGANCTGERRTFRSTWSNTNIEERTGKIYRQTGNYANNWTYNSRSTSTSCVNVTASGNRAYLVSEISLTNYPYGEVETGD